MINVRPAAERGTTQTEWLDSRHSFSFAEYYDPAHMGFRTLRVINDDRVAPGAGFPTHGHADMEILTYVLDGALEHRDSLGTGSVIRPGDLQRMSAGTGVRHSEFNASRAEPVRFLQIWLLPGQRGLRPGYEQKSFDEAERRGRLRLVASPDGRDGSVTVNQDVRLYAGTLGPGQQAATTLGPGRQAWVQVARGHLLLNGVPLGEGDGAAVSGETTLTLAGDGPAAGASEALVFDLP
jgi:redox-sensitive bicupin YhaK (pirin superfamily)